MSETASEAPESRTLVERFLPVVGAAAYLVAALLAAGLPYLATRILRPAEAATFLDTLADGSSVGVVGACVAVGAFLGWFHARFVLGDSSAVAWLVVAALRAFLQLPLAMLSFPLLLVVRLVARSDPGGPVALAPVLMPFLPIARLDRESDTTVPRRVARMMFAWLPVAIALFVVATQVPTSSGGPSVNDVPITRRDEVLERASQQPRRPMRPQVALVFGTLSLGEYLLTAVVVARMRPRATTGRRSKTRRRAG